MKDLVEVIAKALVDNPDEVIVERPSRWNFMSLPLIWVR